MTFIEGVNLDVTNADYHADTEWLSSTRLKRALPAYTEPDNENALTFGTLFHTVVLEPENLDAYAISDDLDAVGLEAAKADGYKGDNPQMTKAWKLAVATATVELTNAGKVLVSKADWDMAHRMADSVRAHATASALLLNGPGSNEESAFWIDDAGVKHKARFDRRIPGAIVDLKSTSCKPLTSDELGKTVAAFGYDLSAAHYLAVADGLALDAGTFALVFVSKHPPHHVYVADLDEAFLADGRLLREQAIDRIINGQRGFNTLTPPKWRRLDYLEMTA